VNSSVNSTQQIITLKRRQILAIFRRHGYTQTAFASDYGANKSAVSNFFKGGVSAPMYEAAVEKANQFLALEESKRG